MSGLDPQVARVLERIPAISYEGMSPPEARRASRERSRLSEKVEPVATVFDRFVPTTSGDVPIRVYAPADSPLPALVFLHGGGWVLGDLDGPDALCRALANRGSCIVISVDYPLAPEFRFPAALEASYEVTRWVRDHGRAIGALPSVAVGGESAGGNLAAGIALMARDRGGPTLAFQLLLMPVLDHGFDTASYLDHAEGYRLTRKEMMWWWHNYLLDGSDGADPYASPLRATDLQGLPPALVLTAEFDPLRDEGESYAKRLKAAGVTVEQRRYPGVVHGFLSMAGEVDVARQAVNDIGTALRTAFGGGGRSSGLG